MNNKIGTIITVIAVLIGGFIGRVAVNKFFSGNQEKKVIEGLNQAAKEINAKCPQQVDDDTRLDKAVSGPGLKFAYFYTLSKYSSNDISQESFDRDVAPLIKKNALTGDGTRTMLKNKIFIEYHYSGNDGKKISSIKLKPTDL